MDATTAPHRIPPEMPLYGETNHIFELMQNMLEQLLIHQPRDPITFMIDHLQRNNDNVPRIVILGPPASGKTTMAMWLRKHLNSNHLTMENLIAKEYSPLAAAARKHYQTVKSVPSTLLIGLIEERLGEEDCVQRGWILDGIPETREQALAIQTRGIIPRHVLILSAPDTVLIERNLGKRVDPQTGEIYHTTFDWPPTTEVQNRLVVPAGISEPETAQKLLEYHRNIIRILPSYPKILKVISADQPCVDVFYQALTYVQTNHRSNAPFTPRVLLCGPTGSGKSLQAALLAQKYSLVNVCCGQLLKEAVAGNSRYSHDIQPFFEKEIAGDVVGDSAPPPPPTAASLPGRHSLHRVSVKLRFPPSRDLELPEEGSHLSMSAGLSGSPVFTECNKQPSSSAAADVGEVCTPVLFALSQDPVCVAVCGGLLAAGVPQSWIACSDWWSRGWPPTWLCDCPFLSMAWAVSDQPGKTDGQGRALPPCCGSVPRVRDVCLPPAAPLPRGGGVWDCRPGRLQPRGFALDSSLPCFLSLWEQIVF